jgi:hypothetical protein
VGWLAALSRTSYLRELHGDLEGAIEAMEQARLAGSGSVFDVALVTALSGNLMLSNGDLVGAETAFAEAERLAPDLSLAAVGRARLALARETSTRPPKAYPIPSRASLPLRL